MKSILITLLSGLLLTACVKKDSETVLPEDPNWIRIEAPTGGEAFDVAGNIDSKLFVATVTKLYRTTNQGKTWDLIWSGNTGPNALLIRKDTLWHMRGIVTQGSFGSPAKVVRTDSPREYSLDAGKTWQPVKGYAEFGRQINRVAASGGTVYTVKDNATNNYVNPSDILKKTGSLQTNVPFPFRHTINSLLLDSKNRLYVAVSGTYTPENNGIYCCPRELPSVVYVSRKPLP